MTTAQFEIHFSRLGLAALPAGVSCEATFIPDYAAATVASAPGAPLTPVSAAQGTLPVLSLEPPDVAAVSAAEGPELVSLQVLGEGGQGRVLLAHQRSLSREVAVKVLKDGAAGPRVAEALVAEARTTGSLEHPGVVPIYALARDARGLPALVMRRIDGVSWRELLHDEQHPAWASVSSGSDRLESHLEVLIQVCNAIAHAHRRGVIHRDLKPANVLLGELGEVYVADWGVAIQKAKIRPGPPRLVGTPAYLAPEMVTGDDALMDERTDVYLLGATLHEVLTRAPPHLGGSLHEVLTRAWESAPPVLGAQVPAGLAQLCRRAMAANPAERFQTVLAFRDALRLFLQHRGSARLAEASSLRLRALEALAAAGATADPQRWYGLISECRFGFGQALEANPKNAEAEAGLERCLEVAALRELEHGGVGSARAFLAGMKRPSPALEQRLRVLEASEAERRDRDAQIAQFAHQRDPAVDSRQRNVFVLVLAATVAFTMVALNVGGRDRWEPFFGRWGRLVPMAIVTAVFAIAMFIGRKSLLSTRLNRQLNAISALVCAAVLASRAEAAVAGTPVFAAVAYDALLVAVIIGVSAILLHWTFVFPAACFVLGSIGCLLFPEHATTVFGVASVLGLLAVVNTHQNHWIKETEDKGVLR